MKLYLAYHNAHTLMEGTYQEFIDVVTNINETYWYSNPKAELFDDALERREKIHALIDNQTNREKE